MVFYFFVMSILCAGTIGYAASQAAILQANTFNKSASNWRLAGLGVDPFVIHDC